MWHDTTLTDADLALYDDLLRLTRGAGAMRLELADGLDQLEAMNGVAKLGYPNLDAYGRERLGRTGRWLGDLRTLNQRLAGLPVLRAAYVTGLVAGSKVELLARHLSRTGEVDDEAQRRALALAEAFDVRKLREVLGAVECPDIGPAPTVQIARAVSRLDAVLFEGAIKLMHALGATTRKDAVEGMLAEAMVTLLDLVPCESEVRADLLARWAGTESQPDDEAGPMSVEDDEVEGQAVVSEPTVVPDAKAGVMLGRFDPARVTVEQVDEGLRLLAAELTRRDMRLGQLGLDAERTGLAQRVGCPDVDSFHREILGVAPSSMAARVVLARRVGRLPQIQAAIEGGAIGFEAASKGSLYADRRAASRPQWPVRSEAFLLASPGSRRRPRRGAGSRSRIARPSSDCARRSTRRSCTRVWMGRRWIGWRYRRPRRSKTPAPSSRRPCPPRSRLRVRCPWRRQRSSRTSARWTCD